MGYSNSSAAYKLPANAAHVSRKVKTTPKQRPTPKLAVVGSKARRRTLTSLLNPRSVSAFVIVVTLVSLIVYNQVCLTEITGEINNFKVEITKLQSEYTLTQSELDSQLSRQTVSEVARSELGLDRESAYQTRWVNLYQEDKIERGGQTDDISAAESFRVKVSGFLNSVKEYIAGQ